MNDNQKSTPAPSVPVVQILTRLKDHLLVYENGSVPRDQAIPAIEVAIAALIEIADLRAQLAAAQAQVHDAGMQLSTSEENLYWCQQREDAALMDVDDLHAQLAAAQAERKAGLQECRDAIAVALEAQSGARDGYRDAIKNITADRDDMQRRLGEAVELLFEVKHKIYGHVPFGSATHIDIFRRICTSIKATEKGGSV
jgi:hypothetical protein